MWALLDDLSRRAVVHMNNDVIASQPGPSHEILMSLPELLRSTYLNLFKPITDMPPSGHDLGFRYATKADATAWGDFIASRLPSVDARSSGLLIFRGEPYVQAGLLPDRQPGLRRREALAEPLQLSRRAMLLG
ncbi:MAG: hypothetical protein E6H82_00325 [Chloroflexi bacterium]|nr:MAG: hypothetical protein E6H82_00325 [Chloroflexota bacterium]